MRQRSRVIPPPPGSWASQCQGYESMSDDPSLPKDRWKECSHTVDFYQDAQPYKLYLGNPTGSFGTMQVGNAFESFTTYDCAGFFYRPMPPMDFELEPFDLEAIARSRSRSSLNLAELMATFKDSLKMLAAPANFVREVARHPKIDLVRKSPLGELDSVVKSAGGAWLGMTYGAIPFVSDVIEASRLIRNPKGAIERALRNTETESYTRSGSTVYRSSPFGVESSRYVYVDTITTVSKSRLIRCEFQVNPTFASMSLANQLATYVGLNDYGRLAWELVPYSFVADWFTSFGNNLAHHASLNGPMAVDVASFSSCSRTRTFSRHSGATVPRQDGQWYIVIQGGQSGRLTHITDSFSRSAPGAGSVGPSAPILSTGSGLTAYKTVSGFALLHGAAGQLLKWYRGK